MKNSIQRVFYRANKLANNKYSLLTSEPRRVKREGSLYSLQALNEHATSEEGVL